MTDHWNYLRACAACAAHLVTHGRALGDDLPGGGEPVFCGKCQPGIVPGAELAVPGARVRLHGEPSYRDWVVLSRDVETVTVRVMGRPDSPVREVHASLVRPEFSYDRLNRSRQARRAS